ncbi:MAG: HPr family phosphocarrier protein [candidate division KSB1 bacterium]|nr:HPr family phosphocarrier protein [candidate division KSB1 bacterium]
MIKKSFTIKNAYGIHARPARLIVETASQFSSDIFLSKEGDQINAKSIMGILMLEASQGSKVELQIKGDDETDALEALEGIFDELENKEEWNHS